MARLLLTATLAIHPQQQQQMTRNRCQATLYCTGGHGGERVAWWFDCHSWSISKYLNFEYMLGQVGKARLVECTEHGRAEEWFSWFSSLLLRDVCKRKKISLSSKGWPQQLTFWIKATVYSTYRLWLAVCFSLPSPSSSAWSCQSFGLQRCQVCQTWLQRL